MKKVKVSENCIGCGACVSMAPNYFEFNEEGLSVAIKEEVSKEDEEEVLDACSSCPVDAIEVKEQN